MKVPTSCLDVLSETAAADPWPMLRELQAQGPVIWHEKYARWLITTDREARSVISNFERFTVQGTIVETLFGRDAFIAMDDRKRHNELRAVWTYAFLKKSLDELRPRIERMVHTLIEPLAEQLRSGESVDVLAGLCRPLPTMVIASMMGVPDEMLPDVVRWSDDMAAGGTAYLAGKDFAAAEKAREDAKAGLANYLREQLTARRRAPRADMISSLVHADVAKQYNDEQLVQNVRQLLFAGNETTAKWLAHLVVTYAEHADVRRELVADRRLIPAANDEVMRWQGVVGTLPRRVRGGSLEVAGIELRDGDHVTCLLASANRDPARYADPDRFDIHRPAQPNLGFGFGFHSCLGLTLAKLEAEVVVNGLVDAVRNFSVAAPYRYSSLALRGPHPVVIAED